MKNAQQNYKISRHAGHAPPRRSANKKKMAIYITGIISILTLVEIRVKRSGNPKHINSIAIGKHKILILQILF